MSRASNKKAIENGLKALKPHSITKHAGYTYSINPGGDYKGLGLYIYLTNTFFAKLDA